MQIAGILLILAVIATYAAWIRRMTRKTGVRATTMDGGVQSFTVLVKGVYSPNILSVKAGRPVRIVFRREESSECSRFVNFPDFGIRKELPDGVSVAVELTPVRPGEYLFTCDMSMYQGRIIAE